MASEFSDIFGADPFGLDVDPDLVAALLRGICRCGRQAKLRIDQRTKQPLCGNCHLLSALGK